MKEWAGMAPLDPRRDPISFQYSIYVAADELNWITQNKDLSALFDSVLDFNDHIESIVSHKMICEFTDPYTLKRVYTVR